MTDDLVKRLNEDFSVNAREDIRHQMHVYEVERREAADRIEQLEAALRTICDNPRDVDKSYAELFAEVCIEARAALAGVKKDG